MSTKIIDIADVKSMETLYGEVEGFARRHNISLENSIHILHDFKETANLRPSETAEVLQVLGLNENQDPTEMNQAIHNSQYACILRRKYFNATITLKKLESTLTEVIFEMSNLSGHVLVALIDIIKNIVKICSLDTEDLNYKELSFRFFTKDQRHDCILLLIVNVQFDRSSSRFSLFSNLFNVAFRRLKIVFFASVARVEKLSITN